MPIKVLDIFVLDGGIGSYMSDSSISNHFKVDHGDPQFPPKAYAPAKDDL